MFARREAKALPGSKSQCGRAHPNVSDLVHRRKLCQIIKVKHCQNLNLLAIALWVYEPVFRNRLRGSALCRVLTTAPRTARQLQLLGDFGALWHALPNGRPNDQGRLVYYAHISRTVARLRAELNQIGS